MPELFTVHTPPDAWRVFLQHFTPHVRTETIPTMDALDRILAQDLHSAQDLPTFARSTVDGYAVAAADTYGASPACLPFWMWWARCRWDRQRRSAWAWARPSSSTLAA